MDTLSLTKEARIYNGLKTISLTSGAWKSGQPLGFIPKEEYVSLKLPGRTAQKSGLATAPKFYSFWSYV